MPTTNPVCVDACECQNDPANWNHCVECGKCSCDLGPNAEEGWTYDDETENWMCPECCEGTEDDEDDDEDEEECEFCDQLESECVTKKGDTWSDCRGLVCAPPKGKESECGARQDNAVKAMDALREICKANPSLIEITKKSECENCGNDESVTVHTSGPVLCGDCSVNEKGEPVCPRDQPFTRDDLCNFCCDMWQRLEHKLQPSKKIFVLDDGTFETFCESADKNLPFVVNVTEEEMEGRRFREVVMARGERLAGITEKELEEILDQRTAIIDLVREKDMDKVRAILGTCRFIRA